MDRRTRLSLLAIGLLLGSVLTAYVVFQIAPLDPLAQFRTADGKLSIPGGHLTADLQRLLFPGPAPTTYWSYETARSSWPTLAISASQHDIPESHSHSAPRPLRPVGTDSLKVFFDALLRLPLRIVSFFTQDAAAACTGGACFWIGGTGNFSDNTHWSLLTGGVTCACTPGATDTVTFDASSGAGTATQDNATFTSGAVTLSSTVTTVNGSSNTWNISGNWNSSAGTFTFGTSTIVATASLSILVKSGSNFTTSRLYNLTVNDTFTVTLGSGTALAGTLTLSGAGGGGVTGTGFNLILNGAGADPIVAGSTSKSVSGVFTTQFNRSASFNIPNISYSEVELINSVASSSITATPAGNLQLTKQIIITASGSAAGSTLVLAMGAFNLTSTSINFSQVGQINGLTFTGGLTFTSGTLTLPGGIFIGATASVTSSYVVWGSSSGHLIGGNGYINGSTSANWSAGTSTVTFNQTTSNSITFCGNVGTTQCGGSGNPEFNNVVFDQSSAGTGLTYTMTTQTAATSNLRVGATLTIQRSAGSGTVTLSTGSNLSIAAGSMTIAANGVLTANGSTVTNSGNWNSSAGTFTYGTSTILVTGSSKTYTFGAGSFYNLNTNSNNTSFDNVSVASGGTLTGGSVTLTVSGNWNSASGTFTFGTSSILVTGASKTYTFGAGSFYNLDMSGNDTTFDNARIAASGTLTVGAATITFGSLTITNTTASMIKDGFVIHGIDISTSSGNIALTTWSNYDGGVGATRWTFNPSVAGATVTITQRGLIAGVSYYLTRDGSSLGTQVADGSGSITFTIVGGWSSHVMAIQRLTGGGGSTPPPVTTPPPSSPSPGFYGLTNADIAFVALAVAVIAAIILGLSYLLGIVRSLRPWLWLVLGMALLIWLVFM